MNIIFGCVLIVSTILLIFSNPEGVLTAMLNGGQKALNLSVKMSVIYAVWLGISELAESSGLSKKIAKFLAPLNKFLFGKIPQDAGDFISLNISANMFGFSGATTPMGIRAIQKLEEHKNTEYAITMFFVINATSVQVIPSSVLALRTSLNSASPSDIIVPTILATMLSTIIGVLLVKVFVKGKQ